MEEEVEVKWKLGHGMKRQGREPMEAITYQPLPSPPSDSVALP